MNQELDLGNGVKFTLDDTSLRLNGRGTAVLFDISDAYKLYEWLKTELPLRMGDE